MDRLDGIRRFEAEAEILVVYQLDLLAQLEAQLRAVHQTMRCIERLRGSRHRVGSELTNGQRGDTLTQLAAELEAIDSELNQQHRSCQEMQASITKMRQRLASLRDTDETQQV